MKTYTARELLSPANAPIFDGVVDILSLSFTEDPSLHWLLGNPTNEKYAAALPCYFRFLVRFALACDAITTIVLKDEASDSLRTANNSSTAKQFEITPPASTAVKAVSITIPPHGQAAFDSLLVPLRVGFLYLLFNCGFVIIWRLLTTWQPMLQNMNRKMFPDRTKKHHNWYLFYICVHPGFRSQGVGREMLISLRDHVRQYNIAERHRAAAQAQTKMATYVPTPIYLEAGSLDSRRLYKRIGFQDVCIGTYGKLAQGEEVTVGDDGVVAGGSQYGMIWHLS